MVTTLKQLLLLVVFVYLLLSLSLSISSFACPLVVVPRKELKGFALARLGEVPEPATCAEPSEDIYLGVSIPRSLASQPG